MEKITEEKFYAFWRDVIVKKFPHAKIKAKNKSLFMRLLGVLLFFNKAFMTRYTTTIGKTIYFPTDDYITNDPKRALDICAHEFVHMWDESRMSGYKFKYLSVQIWAIFSLGAFLAFFNLYFLLFLVCMIFAAPWASPWRTAIETNGYAMNMVLKGLFCGKDFYLPERHAQQLSTQFTSGMYYWMCRDRDRVVQTLVRKYETLPTTHGAFQEVILWLKTQLH